MVKQEDIFNNSEKTLERLLYTIESDNQIQVNKYKSQITFYKYVSIFTMIMAILLPITTWFIVFNDIANEEAENITVFAFTGMTLASVLIVIFVTLLRRAHALEQQASKLNVEVKNIQKMRAATLAEYPKEIGGYINLIIGKKLIANDSYMEDENELDEVQKATSLLGSIQKVISTNKK